MNQQLLKKLRAETGASFLLCKEALAAENDNYQMALDYVNQHQVKEQGNFRVASKGVVAVVKEDNQAILFEVNAETDFISKNPFFVELIENLKLPLLKSGVKNAKDALKVIYNNMTVLEHIEHTAAVVKENLTLRRFYRLIKTDEQTFGTYSHMQGKMAALVILDHDDQKLADELAMQVIANQAQYLRYDLLSEDTIAYEKMMLEKTQGKVDAATLKQHLQTLSLLNQPFFKNPTLTVEQILNEKNLKVIDFYKFEVGQGIDNKLNCRLDIPCDASQITVTPIY